MKVLKFAVIFLVICTLAARPAESEDKKEKVYELKEIVVTATEVPDYVQDVVSKDEVSRPAISGSVLDSLGSQAGVQLQRGSAAGTESSKLRIRGFGETRLRILKDGMSIQRDGSYGNGPVDWSMFSAEHVDHIEIHRGAGPAKFGNTFGGVVNIVTKKAL